MPIFPKRMVYVDDEPRARKLVVDAIGADEDDDYFLVTCATGRELLARFNELQPDLILLDLRMPEMNGPDTIDELRKIPSGNHPAVIFVTDRAKVKMIDDYKALGVIGVLYKPLDKASLRAQIQKLWLGYKKLSS